MFLPTHLVAGLIIGKLIGNYEVSLIGSVVMDLDHLFVYYRDGILLKFKKLILFTTTKAGRLTDTRNIFHNILFSLAFAAVIFFLNRGYGLVLAAAFLVHLFLDALDNQDYFPLYPIKKINFRGPIKYFSAQEMIFFIILFLIFLAI